MKIPTPLYIVICAIIALLASVWWQFNGMKTEFAGIKLDLPDFDQTSYLPNSASTQPTQNTNSYIDFRLPTGNLSFKYPADFQGGENLFGQEVANKLKSNNILLFVYKVSIPGLQPAYIMALESDATTTEAVIERVKGSLVQMQCGSTAQNATTTNPMIFSLIDFNYECGGAQKGYEQWRAQSALIKKENGFYAVSAVSTAKNWPLFQLTARSLFDSIIAPAAILPISESAATLPDQTTNTTNQELLKNQSNERNPIN